MFEALLRRGLPQYAFEAVTKDNIQDVFRLFLSNSDYFSRTQGHPVTLEDCLEDITALPPGAGMAQKHYLAVYRGAVCVAALDFLEGYPDPASAFLGLLILEGSLHGRGLGRCLTNTVMDAAASMGFRRLCLGCFERNESGLAFWRSRGFTEYGRAVRTIDGGEYVLIRMERPLPR